MLLHSVFKWAEMKPWFTHLHYYSIQLSMPCVKLVTLRVSDDEGFHERNTSEEGSTCSSMEVDYKVHEFVILFARKDTIDSQNINNKFSVKYYLNLFLVDEEDRCYIKQQEMMLYRLREETF
ncbi:hypothetical protein YC2023_115428 [Brassica napus]